MNKIYLTIIVPIYNEEENIEKLSSELNQFLQHSLKPAKVLFVNDGSTDKSQDKIELACQNYANFHFILFEKNCGLSAAIKAGFDFSDTEYTAYIDGDLQTTPMDFNLLFEFCEDYELVTGIRSKRQDSRVKRMSSTFANSIRNWFTEDGVEDTGCPLKIIKTENAKAIPMFKGLHRFLPAMIQLQGGKVKQVAVRHFPRNAGTAKFGLRNRIAGPLMDCFAYLWMKRKYINYRVIKNK